MPQGPAASPRTEARPSPLDRIGFTSWVFAAAVVVEVVVLIVVRAPFRWIALAHVAAFSLITFALFGWDKWRAIRNRRRVSESNLLALMITGGALGGLCAMSMFRHKTHRLAFKITAIVSLFIHVAVVGFVFLKS